jgi:hypothetical protein
MARLYPPNTANPLTDREGRATVPMTAWMNAISKAGSSFLFNVLDYGAVGDGVADDTAAFQRTAAAADGGGVMLVPPGNYLITDSITMGYGTQVLGFSTHSTIRPGTGLVTLGAGSIIHCTSVTDSPFVYYSGNAFRGLTFYYPNQLRTLAAPIVYPPTFMWNPAGTLEVLTNNSWHDCQFVNSYVWIDALVGHLDFEFFDLVGATLSVGIDTDGCGGTDMFRNIRMSYYYFCQLADNAQTYMQANSQGIRFGRSDTFHMDRIYCGSMNVGLAFRQGSVNLTVGASGSITGLSLDGNNYGVYSEETHPIGVNIVDFMANSVASDVYIPNSGSAPTVLQVTGFKTWGAKPNSFNIDYAGATVKLAAGEMYSYTTSGVSITATATLVQISNIRFNEAAVAPISQTAFPTNYVVTDNYFGFTPSFASPLGTNVRIEGNTFVGAMPSVASAANISLTNRPDVVFVTGVTNITSMTAGWIGRRVTLIFTGVLTFTDGGNLVLAGNFVTTANDSITLTYDGTNWVEMSRSVN